MKKSFKYILSAAALLMLTATSAFADGEDKGVVANKKVTANEDGTYTLTLEAYATGSSITTVTEESVPLDIVLVLDVSGSMDDNLGVSDSMETVYNSYQSTDYYIKMRILDWPVKIKKITKNGSTYTVYYDLEVLGYTIERSQTVEGTDRLFIKKIDALKRACKLFISNVADESDDDCTHNISIVTYSSQSKTVMGLTSSHGNTSGLINAINALSANGGTRVDRGMSAAKTVLDKVPSSRGSNKLIVMFTDGEPDSDDVSNTAIRTSKELKDGKVTVYSVGVFENPTSKIHQYMSAVSSDKPSATSYQDGDAHTGTYYMTAESTEELENIFDTISSSATAGSTKSTLTATNSSVRDFVTPEFTIVGQAEDIELEVWPSDPSNKTAEPKWLSPMDAVAMKHAFPDLKADMGDADENGNTPVIVTGFDYSANWVGPDKPDETSTTINGWRPEGKKLVIKIKIKLENANIGGVIKTNTGLSGIYSGEGLEEDFESTGIEFPVPQAINKAKAYLHIVKKGLALGESAIFEVKNADDNKVINTVMVQKTGDAVAEAYVLVDWLTSAGKEKEYTSANPLTLDDMVKFVVVEKADWAWNSPDPALITSELYEVNSDTNLWEEYTFTFDAAATAKYEGAHKEISTIL